MSRSPHKTTFPFQISCRTCWTIGEARNFNASATMAISNADIDGLLALVLERPASGSTWEDESPRRPAISGAASIMASDVAPTVESSYTLGVEGRSKSSVRARIVSWKDIVRKTRMAISWAANALVESAFLSSPWAACENSNDVHNKAQITPGKLSNQSRRG